MTSEDREFKLSFETCAVQPAQINHEAHVRLAYIYLVESDAEGAVQLMRRALLTFLEHHGVPSTKYHETHSCLGAGGAALHDEVGERLRRRLHREEPRAAG